MICFLYSDYGNVNFTTTAGLDWQLKVYLFHKSLRLNEKNMEHSAHFQIEDKYEEIAHYIMNKL